MSNKEKNIFRKLYEVRSHFLSFLQKNTFDYPLKHYTLTLPKSHTLAKYQKVHPRYDRFLPCLASFLNEAHTIIDVGANCGDTIAAMVEENSQSHYICIEADHFFFSFLKQNLERIRSVYPNLKVDTLEALVGVENKKAVLKGTKGTRHAMITDEVSEASLSFLSLDSLIQKINSPKVDLLKVDVDGHDDDVIFSAEEIINRDQPMIFFEAELRSEEKKLSYEKMFLWLQSKGYEYWTIFDNFGTPIVINTSQEFSRQLMDYVWRLNSTQSTRTIYYYDILAVTSKDKSLVSDAVLAFNNKFLLKK